MILVDRNNNKKKNKKRWRKNKYSLMYFWMSHEKKILSDIVRNEKDITNDRQRAIYLRKQ